MTYRASLSGEHSKCFRGFPAFCSRLAGRLITTALGFATVAGAAAGTAEKISFTTTNWVLPGTRFATVCYRVDSGNPGPTVMVVGGVHGNEPAGAQAAESIRQWPIRTGKLIVIPRANVTGLAANQRRITELATNLSDLNRDYPRAKQTDNAARGDLAQAIWKIACDNKPDWVLDLHEGYDFHQLNEKSVGSSIICFPIPAGQLAADAMLATVNEVITNAQWKFVRRNMPIDGSLARAAGEHLHVPAMILETTDKQPMELRVREHQIMVRQLLKQLGVVEDLNLDAVAATTGYAPNISPKPSPKIKVALYKGPGTGGNGPPDLMKQLNSSNAPTSLVEITPEEIRAGTLTNFDIVIFAGGSGSQEAKAIGEAGRAEVEKFVGGGGGYVGICAGAYLATAGYPWSLHIINAKTLSPKWQRGKAVLKLEVTPVGEQIIGGETNLDCLYHQGPIVGPANAPELPPYDVLAWFRSEVASNDTPKGIQINSPAIFSGVYQKGKVVCISPHPEQTAGLEYIVPHAVNWVVPANWNAQ